MLAIRNLSKSYGGARPREVLRGIELEVASGEYVAIMGESGIGKSTLLNLIAGLELPDRGTISLDGVELTALDDAARTLLRRKLMGFVFQAFHLLPHLSLAQNVALPLALNGVPPGATAARVAVMLQAVGLSAATDAYPRAASRRRTHRQSRSRHRGASPCAPAR